MNKQEKTTKRKQALKLYLEGDTSPRTIAKSLKINHKTVYEWIKKYGWKEKLEKLNKNVEVKIIESVEEMKVKHIKIINATIAKYIDNLRSNKINVSASEAAKMLQHELELRVPKSNTQLNFMKKEVNINVSINEVLKAIRHGTGL
jgi:transposase